MISPKCLPGRTWFFPYSVVKVEVRIRSDLKAMCPKLSFFVVAISRLYLLGYK